MHPVATLILSRIRRIIRPCASDGERCVSCCTDAPLRNEERELDVTMHHLNGRDVLVPTSKN